MDLSYFQLTYLSQPLTLLHQIDLPLLVYAFQPERPAAPTAAGAKVIQKVKNLYTILKTLIEEKFKTLEHPNPVIQL